MRRFYRHAEVIDADGGYGVALDGRPVRTPAGAPLAVPGRRLAEAIVREWEAQEDAIRPRTMPLMRLASTGIDVVPPRRREVIDEIAGYAAHDLVCYRADGPGELAARQRRAWQPLVEWAARRFDAPLAVTTGVTPRPQPPAALEALRGAVAAFGDMELAGLYCATAACGSLVLALALAEGRLDVDAAWAASQLDETYQIETWGEPAELAARRAALRDDIAAAAAFLALLRD